MNADKSPKTEKLRDLPILKSVPAGRAALYATYTMIVFIVCFCLVLIVGFSHLRDGAWWAIILAIFFSSGMVFCYLIMIAHEKNDAFSPRHNGVRTHKFSSERH
jgi:cyanate permease